MRVAIESNRALGGSALVFLDGRSSPEKHWQIIAEQFGRATLWDPECHLHGVRLMTADPNYRPVFTPGQRIRYPNPRLASA